MLLSPTFLFSPGLSLHHPLHKSHVLWINDQLLKFGRGTPWSAGREIQSPHRTVPGALGSPGEASPEDALGDRGVPTGAQPFPRQSCPSGSLSRFLLAEDQWQGNASSRFPSDVIRRRVTDQLFKTLSLLRFEGWAENFQAKDLGQNCSGRNVQ